MREIILKLWLLDTRDEDVEVGEDDLTHADLAEDVETEFARFLDHSNYPAGVRVDKVLDGDGKTVWERGK